MGWFHLSQSGCPLGRMSHVSRYSMIYSMIYTVTRHNTYDHDIFCCHYRPHTNKTQHTYISWYYHDHSWAELSILNWDWGLPGPRSPTAWAEVSGPRPLGRGLCLWIPFPSTNTLRASEQFTLDYKCICVYIHVHQGIIHGSCFRLEWKYLEKISVFQKYFFHYRWVKRLSSIRRPGHLVAKSYWLICRLF